MKDTIRIFVSGFLLNAPYYLLCCVPFYSKLRVKKHTLFTLITATTVLVAVYYVLRNILYPDARWMDTFAVVIFYLAYFAQYMFCFRLSPPKLLYVFLVVQAYANMVNITAKYIDSRFFTKDKALFASWPYTLLQLSILFISYPFLFRLLRKHLSVAYDDLSDKSFWQLCITPALFFLVNMLYTSVFIRYAFADFQILFIYLLVLVTGFITYFVTLRTALDAAKGARLAAENKNMEPQLSLQAQGYRQLTQNIEQTRAARHDLRHHLAVMAAYVEQGDRDSLAEYLENYRVSLPEDTSVPICGNYAVDTIVRHYLAGAQESGAELDIKITLPMNIGIPDTDLCIVFGNLFENAANSVAGQKDGIKFITSRCSLTGSKLVLTVDNSTDCGTMAGGIGQQSVRAVAEKYQGGVRFERKGLVYKSSVLLCIPAQRPG